MYFYHLEVNKFKLLAYKSFIDILKIGNLIDLNSTAQDVLNIDIYSKTGQVQIDLGSDLTVELGLNENNLCFLSPIIKSSKDRI